MFFRGSDFTSDQLDAMLIGDTVVQVNPELIELRVIEAINLVDLDVDLFKIKLSNDPNYSEEMKDCVMRMKDSTNLKVYWKNHF